MASATDSGAVDNDRGHRLLAWGARGPEFKSRRPDQTFHILTTDNSSYKAVLESKWSPFLAASEIIAVASSTRFNQCQSGRRGRGTYPSCLVCNTATLTWWPSPKTYTIYTARFP